MNSDDDFDKDLIQVIKAADRMILDAHQLLSDQGARDRRKNIDRSDIVGFEADENMRRAYINGWQGACDT